MPSRPYGSSPPTPTPPNAFDPAFLEQLQADGEPLTAAEAELAGPWKREPVPGHPGAVAVLRAWEDQALGDVPQAVLLHEETALLCSAALPLVDREPLFHLSEAPDADPHGALPGGYPVVSVFGEQGPAVSGWLPRFHPGIVATLHTLEALIRTPQSLADVLVAAGPGTLAQVGRILAARQVT
jgi:hypothetical protein